MSTKNACLVSLLLLTALRVPAQTMSGTFSPSLSPSQPTMSGQMYPYSFGRHGSGFPNSAPIITRPELVPYQQQYERYREQWRDYDAALDAWKRREEDKIIKYLNEQILAPSINSDPEWKVSTEAAITESAKRFDQSRLDYEKGKSDAARNIRDIELAQKFTLAVPNFEDARMRLQVYEGPNGTEQVATRDALVFLRQVRTDIEKKIGNSPEYQPLRDYLSFALPNYEQFTLSSDPTTGQLSKQVFDSVIASYYEFVRMLSDIDAYRIELRVETEPTGAGFQLTNVAGYEIAAIHTNSTTQIYRGLYSYVLNKDGFKSIAKDRVDLVNNDYMECRLIQEYSQQEAVPCNLKRKK